MMCMVGEDGEHRRQRAERHREHYAAPPKPATIDELEARLRKLEERVGSNEMATAISNTKMSYV